MVCQSHRICPVRIHYINSRIAIRPPCGPTSSVIINPTPRFLCTSIWTGQDISTKKNLCGFNSLITECSNFDCVLRFSGQKSDRPGSRLVILPRNCRVVGRSVIYDEFLLARFCKNQFKKGPTISQMPFFHTCVAN